MNLTQATAAFTAGTLLSAEVQGGGPVETSIRLNLADGTSTPLVQASGNLPDPNGVKHYLTAELAQADVATIQATPPG